MKIAMPNKNFELINVYDKDLGIYYDVFKVDKYSNIFYITRQNDKHFTIEDRNIKKELDMSCLKDFEVIDVKSEVNIEDKFIKTIDEINYFKFYVPTDEHSSGFNEIELYDNGNGVYTIYKEGFEIEECNFKTIVNRYDKFTLDKKYAFEGKFVNWNEFELACNGK